MTPIGRLVLAGALAACIAQVQAQQPQQRAIRIEINTQGLPPQLAQRLREEARKGRNAVIRYINRTRMIHGLRADEILLPARVDERPRR